MCLAVCGKVVAVKDNTAEVDFGGVKKTVSLGILSGIKRGDNVLVHAGFAIGRVSEAEAVNMRYAVEELKNALKEK